MYVSADISIEDIVEAIEAKGGVVQWKGAPPRPHAQVRFDDVEVDENEAADALPPGWFEGDELIDADPRDVRDFVAACLVGDHATAEALIPRLWDGLDVQAAAGQVLRPVRRAA